jgi:hypothetical protein
MKCLLIRMTQQPRPVPTILIHVDERGRLTQEALRETDFILNRTVGIDIALCGLQLEVAALWLRLFRSQALIWTFRLALDCSSNIAANHPVFEICASLGRPCERDAQHRRTLRARERLPNITSFS